MRRSLCVTSERVARCPAQHQASKALTGGSAPVSQDYVPPAAYRTGGVDVDYVHYEEGAFILFVEQAKELQEAPSGSRGVPLSRLLSDTRILDVLLHNSDRHHGHFLHGEHWAIRNPDHSPMMRPVLIDHAAGFRSEAFVSMEHENAFQTGPVMVSDAAPR